MNKISIIIPAFNEQRRIEKVIEGTIFILNKEKIDYEIIVVNDGSSDKTKEVVKNIKKDHGNLKLISNKEKSGKGFSVRKGCLAASGEIIGFMDADGSVDVKKIREVISAFKDSEIDLLIGSRKDKGGKILKKQPWYRDFAGRFSNFLIRFLVGLDIKDTQCGFKFFSKRFVEENFSNLSINGWLFDVEIIKLAQIRGYKMKILPVEWTNMDESKVKIGSYLGSLSELVRIVFIIRK